MSKKEQRQKRIEDGNCGECGKRPLSSKTRCGLCLKKNRDRSKARRTERLERNLCVQCGRKASSETLCKNCLGKHTKYREIWKAEGLCLCCGSEAQDSSMCVRCIEVREKRLNHIKDVVFEHYGGWHCACCGEDERAFLTIDHMNNDGAEDRRNGLGAGSKFYQWLFANDMPDGFQVLCRNCNWGKHVGGGVCPHKSHAPKEGSPLNAWPIERVS